MLGIEGTSVGHHFLMFFPLFVGFSFTLPLPPCPFSAGHERAMFQCCQGQTPFEGGIPKGGLLNSSNSETAKERADFPFSHDIGLQ